MSLRSLKGRSNLIEKGRDCRASLAMTGLSKIAALSSVARNADFFFSKTKIIVA